MRAIVSNNCWGAEPYKEASMQFNTPFIGLFLYAEDYISLISDFRNNMESDIKFVTRSRRENEPKWPIGIIGDKIEIHFMHYKSVEEANEKWRYRALRLPKHDDDILFKMCDRDGFSYQAANEFSRLSALNKICFYNDKRVGLPSSNIFYPINNSGEECPDGIELWKISREKPDLSIVDWLNGTANHIGSRYEKG